MRPNVLLIVFDTARADAFEPYGAAADASPAIGQLADAGHAAEAFAAAPWTIPSHAAMFSGWLPFPAGMPGSHPSGIAATRAALKPLEKWWLPSVLAASGYQTAAISANGLVSAATGFDMGFDRFHDIHSTRWCSWTGRPGWALQALQAKADDGASHVERMLGEWISGPQRKPFFWFVNLIECHSPYLPPRPYNTESARNRVLASQEWGRYLRGEDWRTVFSGDRLPPQALARMRRLYAGAVRLLDSWVARLLASLDRHGLLGETIVIITSDHGENLGEGGLMAHSYSLDDRLIKVPFVVSGPAPAVPGPRFSLIDLPGWLASCCGLDSHPWRPATERHVAVAQFETYGEPGDPWVTEAAARWGIGELAMRRLTENLTCATNGRRKLVQRGDRLELYDLESDPLEISAAAPGPAEEQRYGRELAALRAALQEAADASDATAAARTTRHAPPGADLEARMKALGYL
jgi:arylsulfatase A-like enzyme